MRETLEDRIAHTELTRETLRHLTEEQESYVRSTGNMPKGFQFHHLLTIADFPEFGDLPESGLALPQDVHLHLGHGGDTTRPLEAATYLDPAALERPGYTVDPEAQKGFRVKRADVASGRGNTPEKRGGVNKDIITERETKAQQLQRKMQQSPQTDPRDERELNRLKSELDHIRNLLTGGTRSSKFE